MIRHDGESHGEVIVWRELNDKQYALDHFYVKLFNIKNTMLTNTGRQRADELSEKMQDFLTQFKNEIT